MVATIKELLTILGLAYCVGCILMGILVYLLIIARIVYCYLLHPEAYKDEEDYER